jgi:hypothetical protein
VVETCLLLGMWGVWTDGHGFILWATWDLHQSIIHVNAMPLLCVGYKPVLARRTNGTAGLLTRELHAEHKVTRRNLFEH